MSLVFRFSIITSILLLAACANKPVEKASDFAQADRNGDGRVSQAEWLNTGGAEAAFLAIDRERKGQLDESAYREAVRMADQTGATAQRQQQMGDEDITNRVRSALSSRRDLNSTALRVETYQRQVTLSGIVRTQQEKLTAEDVARGVSGVTNVFNQIVIRQ
jgi:osmotically-inducible protein OsmY